MREGYEHRAKGFLALSRLSHSSTFSLTFPGNASMMMMMMMISSLSLSAYAHVSQPHPVCGGVSNAPLVNKAMELYYYLFESFNPQMLIIGKCTDEMPSIFATTFCSKVQ